MTIAEQPTMIADGIYPGTSAKSYFHGDEWAGRLSPSVLEYAVEQTFAHVRAAFRGEIAFSTDALEFGSAFHARLLEPDRFKTDFAIAQQCEAETGKKARCSKMGAYRHGGRWFCDTHADVGANGGSAVEVLSARESETIEMMRRRVFAHPAVALLRQAGQCEVCIAWTDPQTGVKCKSRLDKLIPETDCQSAILDLKTIRSADLRSVSNAIEEYGYARAAAMRCDAVEVLTGTRPDYFLIFIEKTPPFELCVTRVGENTMDGARSEVRGYLNGWAHCVKTGKYPGYANVIVEVDAPDWKMTAYRAMRQQTAEPTAEVKKTAFYGDVL